LLVYKSFPGGRAKALTMSYDDGRLADERLISIFNQYGIKGTFNLNGSCVGLSDFVSKEEIKELYTGHEIATHAYHHPSLARCPLTEVAAEILDDRILLEELSGRLVRGHAYPNCSFNQEIKTLLKSLGITYARCGTCTQGFELPQDPLEWCPTCHHDAPNLMDITKRFLGLSGKHSLKLMYVYGHSYEFDLKNNWNVIEEFSALVGGRDDIWYATNGEIIDYLEILDRLQFTANCEKVFNPSAQSAWVTVDVAEAVEIPAGALVDLTSIVQNSKFKRLR